MDVLKLSSHEPIIDSISNPGAERYVLAHVFKYPDSIYDIAMKLKEDDFSVLPNQIIYSTMLRISESAVVDVQTVIASCRDINVLEAVGGEEYISHLTMTTVNTENLDYNIDIVRLLSLKRQSYRRALEIISESVSDEKEDINTFLNRQQQKFIDLSLQLDDIDKVVNLGDDVDEWLQYVATINDEVPGLSTGFPLLDKEIGGLQKTRLYVVAARSKVGKSSLLMNWAANISIHLNTPILYIDTEMPTIEVRSRMLANLSNVFEKKIANGTYTRSKWEVEQVQIARNELKKGQFYHVYLPTFTPEHVYNLSRKYKMKYGTEAVFFDYIKLPESADLRSAAEYQQLGYLTNLLKNGIAGGLDIPVVTGAQKNRHGIGENSDDDTAVAGSDRILHFTNYLFSLRNKTEEELSNHGPKCGNQVLTAIASRHGADYKAWIEYDRPVLRMREVMFANKS